MFWTFTGLPQIFYSEFKKRKKKMKRGAKKINEASEYTRDIKIREEKGNKRMKLK